MTDMNAQAHTLRSVPILRLSDSVSARVLQRKCACGQHLGGGGECAECSKKRTADKALGGGMLKRRPTGNREPEEVPEIVYDVLRSPGHPLDMATRGFFEPRFGHDFSHVRVHTDARAAESARTVNALAYTVGRNVIFAAGQYSPAATAGQRLLAHELTHVVQQQAAPLTENSEMRLDKRNDNGEVEVEKLEREPDFHGLRYGSAIAGESRQPARPLITPIAAGTVQRQLVTPLAPGGGFRGLMERDRRAAFNPTPQPAAESCDFQLCFLPLEVLLERGISPDLAYATANHAYVRWNSASAGFTRLTGESIRDARVISPEPRAGEPHERCVTAKFRTVPTPTPGQLIHFSPLDAVGDLISYGIDVVHGLQHCGEPSCNQARRRVTRMLTDDRRGLYDLFDENCETWARNVLAAACLEAPEFRLGGIGNQVFRILNETTPGRLYHGARRAFGVTRPLPEPGP